MREIASGTAACAGKAKGFARIIHAGKELEKVKQGDVLVTSYTKPEYHNALMKASAIVASTGGRLSHSAIVSRELGIPCIVGVEKALEVIKEGKMVLVDGDEGKIFEL